MQTQHRYGIHVLFSLLLHGIILIVLIVSVVFRTTMPVVEADRHDVINALVMEMPVPPQPTKIVQKPTPPTPQPKPIPPTKLVVKETPPVKAEKTLAIPDKKRQEELIQKQLLADLKKQTEKNNKQKQNDLQKAFEKEMKEVKAKALRDQMQLEQKRLANLRAQQMQGVVDKYKALILQSISQHWLVPPNVDKKRYAELLIRLAPGGAVLDVQLTKSSGDVGLDRSARAAVFKASPLPVPKEANAFEPFRQFVLKVKPENVLANESWIS